MSASTTNPTDRDIEDAEGAYLSLGGWAKEMPDPPNVGERRRFIVDTECTGAGIRVTANGTKHSRSLSIIRLTEVKGVEVPPADTDPNQGELFPDEGGDTGGTGGTGGTGDGNVVPFSAKDN